MKKNETYTGTVEALGSDGEGIVKCEGATVFVPDCLIGEEIRFLCLKEKGGIAYGKLLSVLSPSPDRVEPRCPVHAQCGGCALQHMSYPAQLSFKRGLVSGALKKIAGLEPDVAETVPSERQYRYRNKLVLPVGRKDGRNVAGFYAERSHRIVEIADCPIQGEKTGELIGALLSFLDEEGLEAYDERTGTGCVRHLVAREAGGREMVTVVSARDMDLSAFDGRLKGIFPDYTLLLNVNPSRTNAIFSDEFELVSGDGFAEAEEDGIRYTAGPDTFLQVNDPVRRKLYSHVVSLASDPEAVAIDLYSGGGMLTAQLSRACSAAYGIEAVEEASRCADGLRDLNGLSGRMHNLCGRVEDRLPEVLERTRGKRRVVVCDPPRKGMDEGVVEAIRSAAPEKVILVSCDPATMARDAGLLTGALARGSAGLGKTGREDLYRVESVTPFDMFPQTRHVETVVCLTRTEG